MQDYKIIRLRQKNDTNSTSSSIALVVGSQLRETYTLYLNKKFTLFIIWVTFPTVNQFK